MLVVVLLEHGMLGQLCHSGFITAGTVKFSGRCSFAWLTLSTEPGQIPVHLQLEEIT